MKKKSKLIKVLSLAIIAMTFYTSLNAQCPTKEIYLNNQADVDAFKQVYPNCTEIKRNFIISGADITNLNGLDHLKSIGWSLTIGPNKLLTNLNGLQNIESTGIFLSIKGNPKLKTLNGLEGFKSTGADLVILNNQILENMDGLNNLTTIGNRLKIVRNSKFKNISAIENVQVTNDIIIMENPSFSNCGDYPFLCTAVQNNKPITLRNNGGSCGNISMLNKACQESILVGNCIPTSVTGEEGIYVKSQTDFMECPCWNQENGNYSIGRENINGSWYIFNYKDCNTNNLLGVIGITSSCDATELSCISKD